MLAPQFTTRRMLLLIAFCSVLFLVLSLAVRGQLWAIALSVGIGSVGLMFIAFALFFQVSFVLAKFLGVVGPTEKPVSPFAKDTAPPTYVQPQNPAE